MKVPVDRATLEHIAGHPAPEPPPHRGSGDGFDLEGFITRHLAGSVARAGPWQGGRKVVLNPCPVDPNHTNESAYIVQFASGAIAAGCLHNSCTWDWRTLRIMFEPKSCHASADTATAPKGEGASSVRRTADSAPDFVHIGAFLNEPDEEHSWLVDGLLISGGTSLLVAKPKCGKSIFAQNLAVAVAKGEPFLGRDVAQGVVLLCALEEKPSELRRHLRAIGVSADHQLYVYAGRAPAEAMAWLERETRARQPVLIIVDTLQRLIRLSDLNDYAAVTNAMEPLTGLARESGAHLLLTHHSNKKGGTDGDGVLGSTGLFGAVDTLVQMRRSEQRRTVWSIQRYGDDLQESVEEMDRETFVVSLAGTRQEADERAVRREILAYLEGQAEPVERATIEDHVEGRTALVRKTLYGMVDAGLVQRDGEGKRGSPKKYSKSPGPEEDRAEKPGNTKATLGDAESGSPEDSCFLVPTIYREQENKKRNWGDSPHTDAENTCSQEAGNVDVGREQENGYQEGTTFPFSAACDTDLADTSDGEELEMFERLSRQTAAPCLACGANSWQDTDSGRPQCTGCGWVIYGSAG